MAKYGNKKIRYFWLQEEWFRMTHGSPGGEFYIQDDPHWAQRSVPITPVPQEEEA